MSQQDEAQNPAGEQPAKAAAAAGPMKRSERIAALAAATGAFAVLALARFLTPDARGLGTHEQLMLPPCLTTKLFGIPCPLCGMTTAFAHMARGDIVHAFHAQPAGVIAFILCAALFVGALFSAATGVRVPVPSTPNSKTLALRLGLAVVLAGWAYKLVVHFKG